jgi:hypothetical protein
VLNYIITDTVSVPFPVNMAFYNVSFLYVYLNSRFSASSVDRSKPYGHSIREFHAHHFDSREEREKLLSS